MIIFRASETFEETNHLFELQLHHSHARPRTQPAAAAQSSHRSIECRLIWSARPTRLSQQVTAGVVFRVVEFPEGNLIHELDLKLVSKAIKLI